MKIVVIEAVFSELKPNAQHQKGRGQGSSVRAAFAAAGRDLFKQPRLKRKRITTFSCTVSIGTPRTE
jgi:hypothetical protein